MSIARRYSGHFIHHETVVDYGHDVRIDVFTSITCKRLVLGDYVHIGSHCSISGPGTVFIGNYSTLSHGVRIFTASDDYDGDYLAGAALPPEYTSPTVGNVFIGKSVVIGANTIIMPGVKICLYAAVGALSLVKHRIPPQELWAGIPAKFIRKRQQGVVNFTKQLEENERASANRETKVS